jgi:hypothetical protein
MVKNRKTYTEEFKRDAVRLMRNHGERTVGQVADDLGVFPRRSPRQHSGPSGGDASRRFARPSTRNRRSWRWIAASPFSRRHSWFGSETATCSRAFDAWLTLAFA